MKCKYNKKPTPDFSGDEGHSHLAGTPRTGCGPWCRKGVQISSRLFIYTHTKHHIPPHPCSSPHPSVGPCPGPFCGWSLETPIVLLPKMQSSLSFTLPFQPWTRSLQCCAYAAKKPNPKSTSSVKLPWCLSPALLMLWRTQALYSCFMHKSPGVVWGVNFGDHSSHTTEDLTATRHWGHW